MKRFWKRDPDRCKVKVKVEWCGAFIGRRYCSTHGVRWDGGSETQCPANPPHTATVEAEPGKTTLRLTRDGEVVAVVILTRLTRNQDGTSAQFEDYFRYMRERRIR